MKLGRKKKAQATSRRSSLPLSQLLTLNQDLPHTLALMLKLVAMLWPKPLVVVMLCPKLVVVKDRPIYIPATQYANRAWTVRDYCAVYLQFIRDLCVNYVILTRYVRRIRDTKLIHLWHIRERSIKHTWTNVERSWKAKNCVCISQKSRPHA